MKDRYVAKFLSAIKEQLECAFDADNSHIRNDPVSRETMRAGEF